MNWALITIQFPTCGKLETKQNTSFKTENYQFRNFEIVRIRIQTVFYYDGLKIQDIYSFQLMIYSNFRSRHHIVFSTINGKPN